MSETLQLNLPVLLPGVPDARDACVVRLTDALTATEGVQEAHVVPAEDDRPDQVCIHYDPDRLTLPGLRRLAERAGARITGRYGHVVWEASGLLHQRRARTVAERLEAHPSVVEAVANATGPIRVEFDREVTDEATLRHALADLGVRVIGPEPAQQASVAPAAKLEADEHAGHDHAPGAHAHAHGRTRSPRS